MSGRRRRSEMPTDTVAVVRGLRACREQLVKEVLSVCRPFGPAYRAADDVRRSIDVLADLLTGEVGYFLDPGHGFNRLTVEQWRAWLAWEKGEGPKPGSKVEPFGP